MAMLLAKIGILGSVKSGAIEGAVNEAIINESDVDEGMMEKSVSLNVKV